MIKDTNMSNGNSTKGGAMKIKKTSTADLTSTISNCRFIQNKALDSGGAVYLEG